VSVFRRPVVLVLTLLVAQIGCAPVGRFFEFLPVSMTYDGLHIQIELERSFVDRPSRTLRMDVFRPKDVHGATPTVVLVHGGFWIYGQAWYMDDWGADLAEQGFVAVTIDYRLLSERSHYPDPVSDVLAAISYVRDNATELSVDPSRVGLFGVSSGAHLVLLAGMAPDASVFEPSWPAKTSTGVKAIVEVYGPADFTADTATAAGWQIGLVSTFMGCSQAECPERWREASPIFYARADGPPVFILHGDVDPIVPVSQARALRDKLEAVGESYEFYEVPGAGHFWGSMWSSSPAQEYRGRILDFLKRKL
jgi:acetyl esterase/lipase